MEVLTFNQMQKVRGGGADSKKALDAFIQSTDVNGSPPPVIFHDPDSDSEEKTV